MERQNKEDSTVFSNTVEQTRTSGSAQYANYLSRNVQNGTQATQDGMDLFRLKMGRMENVGYEQGKGNAFEYIEAAKLNRNLANAGQDTRAIVTDAKKSWGGPGENTAPDDFRIVNKYGKVIARGQAKVVNNPRNAARVLCDEKYKNMTRIVPKGTRGAVEEELDLLYKNGTISKKMYLDTKANLTEALTDPSTGISSGGTTNEELATLEGADGKLSKEAAERYAKKMEYQQYAKEIGTSTAYGAAAGAVTSGLTSAAGNMIALYKNEKELSEAVADIQKNVVKGSIRGGATGALSSVLRIFGAKQKIPVMSEAACATVMAGSFIDCGVSVYSYALGEISEDELTSQLTHNVVRGSATIYFSKAIGATFGAVSPLGSMVIFTVAGAIVSTAQAIIANARLNAEQYRRLEALYLESAQLMAERRKYLEEYFSQQLAEQHLQFSMLLEGFCDGIYENKNIDGAIYAMIYFADAYGLQLQHTSFSDFQTAMMSNTSFQLGK